MFRTVIGRIAASAAGLQVCAAGVALTDKELSKKPEWYRKDVLALEDSLKKLGRHGFNTSQSAVNDAYETLKKYSHISNVEVHWRMARALLEKSYFTKSPTERAHLVHEAKDCAKKALSFETEKPSAGAHKWFFLEEYYSTFYCFMYAIALSNLEEIDPKADHSAEILKHLEHAASIDKEDAYTVFLLGVAHYKKKNYSEALSQFQKAETMRMERLESSFVQLLTESDEETANDDVSGAPDGFNFSTIPMIVINLLQEEYRRNITIKAVVKKHFSSSNLYYMGMAYHSSGNKEEAIKHFIASYKVRPKNEHELKSRALAKTMLLKLKVDQKDYEVEEY